MTRPDDDRDLWERPAEVPPDQEWFWTPEWLAGEREASAQIAAGQGQVFYSAEEFLEHLERDSGRTDEEHEHPGQ
ncbi:hypothetical protein AB0A73_23460 [Glycomyces sp. NPDC047369]